MKFSDAEWAVMNAVWRKPPATVRDVWERVSPQTGWAYTTVKTMLERLVEKEALRASKRGNTSLYAPRVSRHQARRLALRALVDRAFDGAFGTLVHHLVARERLSQGDRARLAVMLEEMDRAEDREP